VADKMKMEQKKEFTEITVEQYRERMRGLKAKAGEIEKLREEVQRLEGEQENLIRGEVEKASAAVRGSEEAVVKSKKQRRVCE